MKVTLLDTEEIASSLKELIVNSDEFYWAVAWGSDGKLAAKLLANEKKIKKNHYWNTFLPD